MDEETAWAALSDAAAACGMNHGEIRQTFLSGWRSGCAQPFYPDWAEEDHQWPVRTWDEFGLGDRMVDRFADTIRWDSRKKTSFPGRAAAGMKRPTTPGGYGRPMIESLTDDEIGQYSDEGEQGKRKARSRHSWDGR